jgi:hypothetical protein
MGVIDRQRIAAVKAMEAMGFTFDGVVWNAPGSPNPITSLVAEADALHAALVLCADTLEGCAEGSPEERDLGLITEVITAYEAKRWPNGRIGR